MLDSIPFIASGLVLAVIGLLAIVQFSGGQSAGLHRVASAADESHTERRRERTAKLNAALISLLSLVVVGAAAAMLIAALLA